MLANLIVLNFPYTNYAYASFNMAESNKFDLTFVKNLRCPVILLTQVDRKGKRKLGTKSCNAKHIKHIQVMLAITKL